MTENISDSGKMDKTQKVLAACGVLAPVSFVIGMIVASALTPGYSHAAEQISALGSVGYPAAPVQIIVGFILSGLLIIAFAVGLHRGIPGESKWGPAFLVLSGIGLVGVGVFQCDPGCTNAPFTGSLRDSSHFVMFNLAEMGAIIGILLTGRRLSGHPQWSRLRSFSLLIGWGTLVIFIAWYTTPIGVYVGDGTMERIVAGLPLLWTAVMGIRLLSPPPVIEGEPA